jgi:hypothetical protein
MRQCPRCMIERQGVPQLFIGFWSPGLPCVGCAVPLFVERKSLFPGLDNIMKTITNALTIIGCGGLLLLTGCASVVCGTKQAVALDSRPRGAQVLVYNPACEVVFSNTTPCTANLARKAGDLSTDCYVVLIRKEGYAPVQVPLVGRVNGAYYWNLLTAGVGFLIDPVTGGMWTLGPDKVDGDLVADKAGFFSGDGLLITLKKAASQPVTPAMNPTAFSELTQVSVER